ncbi:MAG TPA: hypothetical protein VIV57_15000, partial [Anaeromyxobacter sp.]
MPARPSAATRDLASLDLRLSRSPRREWYSRGVASPGRLLPALLTHDDRVAELAARWLDLP